SALPESDADRTTVQEQGRGRSPRQGVKMFARWRAAGLIVPSLLTLALLPVLIGLGNWQWHRKAWKEGLIAKIEARTTAEPVSYPAALAQYIKTGDVEYLHVRVTGTYDYSQERHLYAPTAASQGWHIY